ncbi:MAG: multidrug efflux MFS transporter [Chloroflexi bacterium]|nr:MAG: multidrug efflux MFS transporter [Chloroflexota bacterium]
MAVANTRGQTARNPWLVLIFLSLGFFMILLDTTIVNIAIPSIISALHSSLDQILWVLNAYLLVYAVLLITCGRLGDIVGQRRLFILGLVLFTAASALCGVAQDGNQLIAARILQGVGGAILTPPDLRPGRRHQLDLVGVVLASAGLFGVVFGLVEGQRYDWGAFLGPITIPEVIIAGLLVFAAFIFFERFQREPLLPLSLFRNLNFSIAIWVSAVVAFGMLGFFLPVTIFLQSVLGFSALKAGLTFLPMSLVSMIVAPFAGRLSDRFGGKYLLMLGLTCFAAGMGLVVYLISLSATQATFWGPAALAGVGMGMTFAPLTTVAMRDVRPQMAGAASGVLNTVRQLGGSIGSAVIGAVLQNRLATELHDQAVAQSGQVPPAFRGQFVNGFSHAASSGFKVGVGQSGGVKLPAGIPPAIVHTLQSLFKQVFDQAYTNAVRPTLVVSIVVLAVGALSCLAIEGRGKASARAETIHREVQTASS